MNICWPVICQIETDQWKSEVRKPRLYSVDWEEPISLLAARFVGLGSRSYIFWLMKKTKFSKERSSSQ